MARFGIGFWSVFTIAHTARIKSAPFEYLDFPKTGTREVPGLDFDVSIDEFKDFTVFRPVNKKPGTSIELFIKDNISIDDINMRLSYHIACSEIPISIQANFETYSIPNKLNIIKISDNFGTKAELIKSHQVQEYLYESDNNDIEFKLFILGI